MTYLVFILALIDLVIENYLIKQARIHVSTTLPDCFQLALTWFFET